MDHRLLVLRLQERHRFVLLLQRLPDSADVAVTEDPENRRDQPLDLTVTFGVLGRQVPDHGLADGESDDFALAQFSLQGSPMEETVAQVV